MGAKGFTIESHDQIAPVLDVAFSIEGPILIDAKVDRYEPMLPPILPEIYARNLRKALPETPGADEIRRNIERGPLVDARELDDAE